MAALSYPRRMDFLVLGITGLLTLSVFPLAILAAREASRQETCEDHLKRIAQAILLYESRSSGALPSIRETPSVGWNAQIGPYLDSSPAFPDDYNFAHDWWDQTSSHNRAIGELRIAEFLCPAAPHGDRWIQLKSDQGEFFRAAPSDFVASAGAYLHTNDAAHLYRGAFAVPGRYYGASQVTAANAVYSREISDGTSHTLLIVEMADKPHHWRAGKRAPSDDDDEPVTAAAGISHGQWIAPHWNHLRSHSDDGTTAFGPCGVNCSNGAGIYGFHQEGANVAMVDGSVRMLRNRLPQEILVALVSIADKELLSARDY